MKCAALSFRSLFLVPLLCAINVFGQGEAATWYFGDYAGVHFGTNTIDALLDSKMQTREGCAVISDHAGNLLFYTDGETIWDRSHNIMPGGSGLKGNKTSTQSGVIVKKPGSESIYYIFTANGLTGNKELGSYYTVVDLSVAQGVVLQRNIQLVAETAEKISAVLHENGRDVWIAIPERDTSIVHTFLLTENGLSHQSIENNVGTFIDGWAGYMKFSPDGSKLGIAFLKTHKLLLADFDHVSGIISNVKVIFVGSPYGLEFSADSRFLYISRFFDKGDILVQYDALATDTLALKRSGTAVVSGRMYNNYIHALQLAPDGKIYFVQYDRDSLGVIEFPGRRAFGCMPKLNAVGLNGRKNILGLPCFLSSVFDEKPGTFAYRYNYGNCDYSFSFVLHDSSDTDSAFWDFDDPGSPNNEDKGFHAKHTFPGPGKYRVRVVTWKNGAYSSYTHTVTVLPMNSFSMPDKLFLCPAQKMVLDYKQQGASYRWNTGDTTGVIYIRQAGKYKLILTDSNGCVHTDSSMVIMPESHQPYLGADTALCFSDVLELKDLSGYSFTKYRWQTHDTTAVIYGTQGNTYMLVATDEYGCTTYDDIEIGIKTETAPVFIPTAFSPDANTLNESFPGAMPVRYDLFRVYDRWGQILYSNTAANESWNGFYNGSVVPEGVYLYTLSYRDCNNEKHNLKGTVTVFR